MTSTDVRPSTEPGRGRRRVFGRWERFISRLPGGRMRWVVGSAMIMLAVLITGGIAYASWLGGGLLRVYNTAQDKADIAQRQLEAIQVSLEAGDQEAAERHVRRAARAIDEAHDVARVPQVRVAKWLPFTRGTVSDLDHLLTAATVLVDSADDAVALYSEFSGDRSKLFADGTIDIDALVRGRDALRGMLKATETARDELRGVDGSGPLGKEALEKKRTGLKQIRELRQVVVPLAPLVEALPDAVGAAGTKRYLVAIMNPAEMRASGGAPLSVALAVFKNGKLTIPMKGTASSLYVNSPEGLLGDSPQVVWKRVKGDAFQPPLGEPQRFVNTTFNPDFRVSGEQLVRATRPFFGVRTDGVIALDVVALAELLRVVGPVESDYGTLTADNLVDELLVKAYEDQGSDIQGRQERNDQLMSVLLSDLMAGGNLRGKSEALLATAPGRHLQMYFRDGRLQRLARDRGLDGSVPTPEAGNLTAVYTQNGNGSKVDVYQRRTIVQLVQLHEDGSAVVSRTVRLENPTPPYRGIGPDIRRGYTTRWATNLVTNLMPPGAKLTQEPTVELKSTVRNGVDGFGRTFAQAAVQTPPGGMSEISWQYEVPHAAVKKGDGWILRDHVAPQGTVGPTLLQYTVIQPAGWVTRVVDPSQYWLINEGNAFLQINVNTPQVLKLEVAPQ